MNVDSRCEIGIGSQRAQFAMVSSFEDQLFLVVQEYLYFIEVLVDA
jgi:hypothetical protein